MNENLKVNANSSVLEHKRKHNLLVDAVPVKDTNGNYKIFENIIDAQGNPRFIEGEVALPQAFLDFGAELKYGKWSLSGTHLMIVVGFDILSTFGSHVLESEIIELPQFIKDKIVILGRVAVVAMGQGVYFSDGYDTQGNFSAYLFKETNGFKFGTEAYLAVDTARTLHYRLKFDLLIDNEQGE